MHAKRHRPAGRACDDRAVFGNGDDGPTGEQWHQAHTVEAGARGIGMNAEEIQSLPSKGMGLSGPVLQEREGVFSERLPFWRRPVRMSGHGQEIGDTLNPLGRHAVGHLQEDGMAAGRADG